MKALSDEIPTHLNLRFHMCGTTYPNRNYSICRPQSGLACIEYVESGSGYVSVAEQQFFPQAGDTYFLSAGVDHNYGSDRKTPWQKIWVNVSGEYIQQLSRLYGIEGIYHFPALDTSDLLAKLQYYSARTPSPHNAEKCISLLHSLFFRMSRSLHAPQTPELSPVQSMLSYIEQHETDVIRLEQLAAVCNRSASQAERLFRAELGMPIYRYILNRKIRLAEELLVETGMTVQDIASYLSFEDPFYFSGVFRKKTGLSPTQYRKKAIENHTARSN